MAQLTKGIVAFFFSVAILLAATPPASAAFTWYDWTGGYQLVHDPQNDPVPPTSSLQSGQDIRNAFYAVNDGYRYFRLQLWDQPNRNANGFASIYGFFINTGGAIPYPGFTGLLGLGVDSYLAAGVQPKLGGGLKFTPNGGTIVGGTEYAFELHFDRNGYYLDWAIPVGQLPDTFTWLAATINKDIAGTMTLLDKTAAVATPIPNAAWLLGSGIVGLIGLKRRKDRTNAAKENTFANAAHATPIPNAAWLLGSGIIGLIGLQRRRARKA